MFYKQRFFLNSIIKNHFPLLGSCLLLIFLLNYEFLILIQFIHNKTNYYDPIYLRAHRKIGIFYFPFDYINYKLHNNIHHFLNFRPSFLKYKIYIKIKESFKYSDLHHINIYFQFLLSFHSHFHLVILYLLFLLLH